MFRVVETGGPAKESVT